MKRTVREVKDYINKILDEKKEFYKLSSRKEVVEQYLGFKYDQYKYYMRSSNDGISKSKFLKSFCEKVGISINQVLYKDYKAIHPISFDANENLKLKIKYEIQQNDDIELLKCLYFMLCEKEVLSGEQKEKYISAFKQMSAAIMSVSNYIYDYT